MTARNDTTQRFETARSIVREHYGLTRQPTDVEVNAEVTSIRRKRDRMSLDDRDERLCVRFDLAGIL